LGGGCGRGGAPPGGGGARSHLHMDSILYTVDTKAFVSFPKRPVGKFAGTFSCTVPSCSRKLASCYLGVAILMLILTS
jgi:hypothetical protein